MAQEMGEINSKGTYHLHGKERNPGWKIKRSAPFRLGSFRKHRLGLEAMQLYFFYPFEPVNMIWICFGVGRPPTTSNFIDLFFMQKIFTRVVHVNRKHPGLGVHLREGCA